MTKKNLIKKLKPYWNKVDDITGKMYTEIAELEEKMAKELDIEDLEIFFVDGEPRGVGNASRTMKLIHAYEIRKTK